MVRGLFQATDKDAGKHGKIQYSLRGEDAEDFVVNPETGTVYCARPMDDCADEKTFQVVAKDNDGKPEGSESTMTVTVSFRNQKPTAAVHKFVSFQTIIFCFDCYLLADKLTNELSSAESSRYGIRSGAGEGGGRVVGEV